MVNLDKSPALDKDKMNLEELKENTVTGQGYKQSLQLGKGLVDGAKGVFFAFVTDLMHQ